jgi:hypothetical protein
MSEKTQTASTLYFKRISQTTIESPRTCLRTKTNHVEMRRDRRPSRFKKKKKKPKHVSKSQITDQNPNTKK